MWVQAWRTALRSMVVDMSAQTSPHDECSFLQGRKADMGLMLPSLMVNARLKPVVLRSHSTSWSEGPSMSGGRGRAMMGLWSHVLAVCGRSHRSQYVRWPLWELLLRVSARK